MENFKGQDSPQKICAQEGRAGGGRSGSKKAEKELGAEE